MIEPISEMQGDKAYVIGSKDGFDKGAKQERERILKIASDFISPSAYNRIGQALQDKGGGEK